MEQQVLTHELSEPTLDPAGGEPAAAAKKTSPTLRLVLGGGVLAALLIASFLLPVKELLTSVLDWTESLGLWGPVLLAGFYVVACVLLLPGSLLTLGAGALFGLLWATWR